MVDVETRMSLNHLPTRIAIAFEERVGITIPQTLRVRDTYLPPDVRGTPPNVDPEGTDLSMWAWQTGDRILGIAFQANANKPLFYNRFRSEADRSRAFAEAIRNRKSALERKRQEQDARRMYKHDIKPGDIYYTSWGYDQTNVDFYEVIAVAEKSISVREVAQRTTDSDPPADRVVPVPGKFVGPILKKVPNANGFSVENHYARKWDGKPAYQTTSGWGH